MDELEYPSLYQAANLASLGAQRKTLNLARFHGFLLLLAAGLSLVGLEATAYSYMAGVVLIVGTIVSMLMLRDDSQDQWYRARALAESTKTIAWRFMMAADPFPSDEDSAVVEKLLSKRLRFILGEHKQLAETIGGRENSGEQITEKMRSVRHLKFDERKQFYLEHRVIEQQDWYRRKSKSNRIAATLWFWAIIICHLAAIVFVFLRVAAPQMPFYPVELLLVASAVLLSWVQLKRFKELAAAYGLTEQEIGFVRIEAAQITNEELFSQFVDDSENAFSREHTQWLARKDAA